MRTGGGGAGRARVLAGDGFYYDAAGNAMALCCVCLEPIDLQHDRYYEVSAVWRKGVVGEGGRCARCWEERGEGVRLQIPTKKT